MPPVADAIASQQTGERLGLQGEPQLYSSIDQSASPEEVAQRIAEILGAKPK